jgi:signal peptidase I
MSINLALILTVLTLFTGVVVAIDKFLWRKDEQNDNDAPGARDVLVEYSRSFFPVLLFVLIIRSFVFEPFRIPSGSMEPTLVRGDFIFVQKYAYGLRLPVTETKVVETGSPERGDVVVFRYPPDPSVNYIKRVVGLPGDEIVYKRHRLWVNGEEVPLQQAPDADRNSPRFIETLGEREHDIYVWSPEFSQRDGTYRVPAAHYFVLGDNRDKSKDSRYIGFIPETHLVGEAVRIWLHVDGWSWPRWERIGTRIQ